MEPAEEEQLLPLPVPQGPPQAPVAAENAADDNSQLNSEVLAIAKKYRVFIPFMVLLLIKLILDNSMPFIFISLATYGIMKIKNKLDLQIALKIKSNTNMFVYLLTASLILLSVILIGIQISGIPDHVSSRLLFSYGSVKDKPQAAFLHTLWCCLILDSLLQAITLFSKCIACLCIGTQSFQCASLRNFIKYGEYSVIFLLLVVDGRCRVLERGYQSQITFLNRYCSYQQ